MGPSACPIPPHEVENSLAFTNGYSNSHPRNFTDSAHSSTVPGAEIDTSKSIGRGSPLTGHDPSPTALNSPWAPQARLLLHRMLSGYTDVIGLCSSSGSVYDTAWVALVLRRGALVFPECFHFIYASQSADGGWSPQGDSTDRILNTLAGLLVLTSVPRAIECPLWPGFSSDCGTRAEAARVFLAAKLHEWDVDSCDYVGFELLVPRMLELLARESLQTFKFPGREKLYTLHDEKMKKFRPDIVYSCQTTLHHSLEAFTERLDIAKVGHIVGGSMMGSPSSTAAYLMASPEWSDECEGYLRRVLESANSGIGWVREPGSVPSAYPTTVFELTWVFCTLCENGFQPKDFDDETLGAVAGILQQAMRDGRGLVGFARGLDSDADDTAKSLVVMRILGLEVSLEPLVKTYETRGWFQTYRLERNPSFSVNCNVLLALLYAERPWEYISQITKCVRFLSDKWMTARAEGQLDDKWHRSPKYPLMLLAQAFIRLVYFHQSHTHRLALGQSELVQVLFVLQQLLLHTLLCQQPDGSWGNNLSLEETSYGIITLSHLASLPCVSSDPSGSLGAQVRTSINSGRNFLRRMGGALVPHHGPSKDRVWVGKIAFASSNIQSAYILAAFRAPVPAFALGGTPSLPANSTSASDAGTSELSAFYSRLLGVGKEQWGWLVDGAIVESRLALKLLESEIGAIFGAGDERHKKYAEYIAFGWIGTSRVWWTREGAAYTGVELPPKTLLDMVFISLFNHKVDEYMDALLRQGSGLGAADVVTAVESVFASQPTNNKGNRHAHTDNATTGATPIAVLTSLASLVLNHPSLSKAPPMDLRHLSLELRLYLLSHATQQQSTPSAMTYHRWLRSSASDSVSANLALSFLFCLQPRLSPQDQESRFLAMDICASLSSLARIQNDLGSAERDRLEGTINSVNFDGMEKAVLERIEGYERSKVKVGVEKLEMRKMMGVAGVVQRFAEVVEFFGRLWKKRDLSNYSS